jgi:hypothetical protein
MIILAMLQSGDFAELVTKMNKRSQHLQVLNHLDQADVRRIQQSGWKVVIWYIIACPVCIALNFLIIFKSFGQRFYYSGDVLTDVGVALASVL